MLVEHIRRGGGPKIEKDASRANLKHWNKLSFIEDSRTFESDRSIVKCEDVKHQY